MQNDPDTIDSSWEVLPKATFLHTEIEQSQEPQNVQQPHAPHQITILSIDYDSCGDILFEQAIEKGCLKNELNPHHEKYLSNCNTVVQATRAALNNYLSNETINADIVELLVGSTRQTRRSDKCNQQEHNNGSCFELYADLAEQKGWYFNKLLLADVENECGTVRKKPFKPGTAMGILRKNDQGNHLYEQDNLADRLLTATDPYKIRILTHQLQAIINKYPDDQIKFIFIDDREDILSKLKYHFMDKKKLHSSADIELKLVHFDITELLKKYEFEEDHTELELNEAEQQIKIYAAYNLKKQQYIATSKKVSTSSILNPSSLFYPPTIPRANTSPSNYIYSLLKISGGALVMCILSYFLVNSENKHASGSQMTP